MSKVDNLRPCEHKLTSEEARRGAYASAEVRRNKKSLRLALEMLLEKEMTSKSGEKMSGTEAVAAKLFEQALKGNVKAFETLRSTVGQDPVQKIMVADVEQSVIDEVEAMVRGDSVSAAGSGTKEIRGKILKVDKDTGEILAGYATAAEAARANGIDRSNLSKGIKNGKAVGGFKWIKKE